MTAPHANHPTPADLAAFAVGKLADADARTVAAHLDECGLCRQAAEGARDSFGDRLQAAGPAPSPHSNTGLPGAAAAPATEPLSDLPPELAGHPRYRILRELGRGGMGVVYQARQTVMDRPVVIKVINQALLDNPNALERFRRETRAAAKLSHPNIVTAYDAEQAGDLHMLVMEFVPGQSLAEVLHRKGPFAVAQACDCVRQAALGLQHAFEQGMVHRDIKPQNLMVTPHGQVKVLDFGLAKLASERRAGTGLTASGAYMGTPDYSAPEQATDARKADIRADVYSLGCTLYCLLAGRPPFQEETPVLAILAHLEKQPRPLPELRPDVPAALWAVVARLLAKDPGRRYQTPAEVARALAPFARAGGKAGQVPARVPPRSALPEREELRSQDTPRPPGLPKSAAALAPAKIAPGAAAPAARRRRPGGRAAALVVTFGLGGCLLGGLIVWAAHLPAPPGATAVPRMQPPAPPAGVPPAVQLTPEKPAAQPALPAGKIVRGSGKVAAEERKVAGFTSVYGRTVGAFLPLKVGPILQVAVHQGDIFRVAVTADDNLLPFIKTIEGQDIRIFLETEGRTLQPTTPVQVTVTMPALEGVHLEDMSGDGVIRATVEGFRPVNAFRVRLTGNSSLEGEIGADTVFIDACGRNEMNVRGSGKNVRINARPRGGECHLRLADFAAENLTIDMAGPSRAEVQARGHLDYILYPTAQLEYRGSPAIGTHVTYDPAAVSHVRP
jgi:hypothetical protein